MHGARAAAAALGAGAIAFLVACLFTAGIVTVRVAAVAWGVVALSFIGALAYFGRDLRKLRAGGAARLLARHDPALASSLRSAYELSSGAAGHGTSAELRMEHAKAAGEIASRIDAAKVTPWSEAAQPAAFGGIAVVALVSVLVSSSDRLTIGAFALLHPAHANDEGELLSDIVRSTRARLSFPAHVGRAPVEVSGAETLEAPVGTHVRYAVTPRTSVRRVALSNAEGQVSLGARPDGTYVGEFLVTKSGRLEIRMTDDDDRWMVDARRRAVRAIADSPPSVALHVEPLPDSPTEGEMIAFRFEASDDHGIREVQLVVEA
ncbi:MAG: DUF4175 family protein, partial [Polyangiaceae bacterium]|nr:DUF4175 family protein [Polyangiaceae bacterium]